jgi:hypothetical protein
MNKSADGSSTGTHREYNNKKGGRIHREWWGWFEKIKNEKEQSTGAAPIKIRKDIVKYSKWRTPNAGRR